MHFSLRVRPVLQQVYFKNILPDTGIVMKTRRDILNIFDSSFRKFFLKLLLITAFTGITINLYSTAHYDTWGISREKVMKNYITAGQDIKEFTPSMEPDYENKIMNMVNLILKNVDSNVYDKIKIISTKTVPRKDFLFFNDKLFSIMEYYNSISADKLKDVINTLSKQYGDPNHNTGNEMDIYFIAGTKTKIIIHYFTKTKKCEIYYYDSKLYYKLSSNKF